jgi:hypothetical protein
MADIYAVDTVHSRGKRGKARWRLLHTRVGSLVFVAEVRAPLLSPGRLTLGGLGASTEDAGHAAHEGGLAAACMCAESNGVSARSRGRSPTVTRAAITHQSQRPGQ